MKPPSRPISLAVFVALIALMLATRFHHFGTALNLPDASMAVFFLGGLYLRRHGLFVVFIALAVAIDWISIDVAGVSNFCVTPAYAFVLPAFATLWYGGRAWADRLQVNVASVALALAIAIACSAVSFAITNGAFYWLGGRYAQPNLGEYLARLWTWGPLFVRTTSCYVGVALLAHLALLRWAVARDAAAPVNR